MAARTRHSTYSARQSRRIVEPEVIPAASHRSPVGITVVRLLGRLLISICRVAYFLLRHTFQTTRQVIGFTVSQTRRAIRRLDPDSRDRIRTLFVHYLPAWVLLAVVLVILLSQGIAFAVNTARSVMHSLGLYTPHAALATLFTPEVERWADDISRWSYDYDLDPNLLATVMQIESCGHPTVTSSSGAQGLFQVMPFHFDLGEDQLDPDTNAKRGADFLQQCLAWADGDIGRALACYNGGPSVLTMDAANWSDQTRRYFVWGTGIYQDAVNHRASSDTLTRWLEAGGRYLCAQASATLGIN